MNNAVLYLRVSTEEQAKEGVSLDVQHEKLQAYCQLQGLNVLKVIREEGISGAKPLASRPGGEHLLDLVNRKKVQHVVSLKLDRLFRDAADALTQTKAWDNAGIALHLVDIGGQTVNTASAMGRFFLSMMASFAELERNLISERTTVALAHKKSKLEAYAATPYGFSRDGNALTKDPGEQRIVSKIIRLRKKGATLRSIARRLNTEGVPTKKGGRWYASTVKYVLANDLYAKA